MNRCGQSRAGRLCSVMAAAILCAASLAGPAQAQAQQPARGGAQGGRAGAATQGRGDVSSVAELQRFFDAYIIIRAQEALKMDDEHFTQFLPKLRTLQETRRRGEQTHNQLVAELARMTAPTAQFDEAKARETLQALQDLSGKTAAELRKAYEAVDQSLDVRQQARFRVFEVQMERRKLDLMLQARRADAARLQAPEPPIKKD